MDYLPLMAESFQACFVWNLIFRYSNIFSMIENSMRITLFIFCHCTIILILRNTYTVLHIFRQVLFGAENQGNHQNFEKSLLSYKFWLIFIGMKQKNFFFEKKNSKWPTKKKLRFSTPPILNISFQKFHGLVLGLVGLIDAMGIDFAQPI